MPERTLAPGPNDDRPSPSTEMAPWRPSPYGTPYPVRTDFAPESTAPWEPGRVADEDRLPGTRRLWLAGGLAVAVLIAAATAIAVQRNDTDISSGNRAKETGTDTGLVIPPGGSAAATDTTVAAARESAPSSPQSSPSAAQGSVSPEPSGQGSDDRPVPGPSQSASADKSPTSKPASARKSLQSVNYPDRYWHVSDGFVRLDPVSTGSSATTRQEAGFTVVKGLANSSCYSFTTADGAYPRHRNLPARRPRRRLRPLREGRHLLPPGVVVHRRHHAGVGQLPGPLPAPPQLPSPPGPVRQQQALPRGLGVPCGEGLGLSPEPGARSPQGLPGCAGFPERATMRSCGRRCSKLGLLDSLADHRRVPAYLQVTRGPHVTAPDGP